MPAFATRCSRLERRRLAVLHEPCHGCHVQYRGFTRASRCRFNWLEHESCVLVAGKEVDQRSGWHGVNIRDRVLLLPSPRRAGTLHSLGRFAHARLASQRRVDGECRMVLAARGPALRPIRRFEYLDRYCRDKGRDERTARHVAYCVCCVCCLSSLQVSFVCNSNGQVCHGAVV